MWTDVVLGIRRTAIPDFARYFDGPQLMPDVVDLEEADGGPWSHHRVLKSNKVLPDGTPRKRGTKRGGESGSATVEPTRYQRNAGGDIRVGCSR